MDISKFNAIVEYGNDHWGGKFTSEEKKQNAQDYLYEFNLSNEQGSATSTMQELCKLLIEDIENGSQRAWSFLDDIDTYSNWSVEVFQCEGCGKKEVVFFSKEELENLEKHEQRKMLIQDALPDKPQWIREVYVSGTCMCPDCWKKYWTMN